VTWFVTDVLPWIMSVVSITQVWASGHKKWWAWRLASWNQLLWTVWIVYTGTWGFLLLNAVLWYLSFRNHRLWNVPAPPTEDEISRVFEYVYRKGAA
jgi:hypothetical protein